MKRTLALLVPLLFSLNGRAGDLDEMIRVRLEKSLPELTLTGTGLYFVGDQRPQDSIKISRWNFKWDQSKRGWIAEDLNPNGKKRFFAGGRLEIRGEILRSVAKLYPSRLSLIAKAKGFDLIGELNFREYLAGVVSKEMPLEWPLETLKAQTVAARSYALAVRNERRDRLFHVESSIEDQVFQHDSGKTRSLEKVRRAVGETDGVLLKTPRGSILKAYYHADCGGRTVSAKEVWGTGPDMGTATDPSCLVNPRALWTMKITSEEMANRLSNAFKALQVTGLSLMPDVLRGHITKVKVESEAGAKWINANDFRLALGPGNLRSTNFAVKVSDGKFEFKGKGFGHGVGLCQWGSKALGAQGWEATRILQHYYPRAVIN